jgi:hypothetical protein
VRLRGYSLPRGRPHTKQKGNRVTGFNVDEQEALALLTSCYPAGIAFTEDRGEAIEVCEALVASGHAIRIRSDDFEGIGYQLSLEMAAAHQQVIAARADEAGQN